MKAQNLITSFSKAGRQIDRVHNKNCPNAETPLYHPRKPMRLIKYKHQLSPQFLTPGRQKLSSFLLFYQKYNASKNDYNKNYNMIDKNQKSFTVPKHNFQRMIQYSRAKRFVNKGSKSINVCDSNIFLNSKFQLKTEFKNNKKSLRHLQFSKMESHDTKFRSYYDWNKFDKSEKQISSTQSCPCNKSFKQINQPKKQHNRAHQFKSYTERKFLQLPKKVTSFHQEQNTYFFDMQKVNFQKIKKNWSGHAYIQFNKYKPKINVRNDRADPVWSMMNQYTPNFKSIQSKIKYPVFQKILNRKLNLVPNEYPFRLSMEMVPRQILLRQKKMLKCFLKK